MRQKDINRIIVKRDEEVKKLLKGKYEYYGRFGVNGGIYLDLFINKETCDILLMTACIFYNMMCAGVMERPAELMIEITAKESGLKPEDMNDIDRLLSREVIDDAVEVLLRAGELVLVGFIDRNESKYAVGHTGYINYTNCQDSFHFSLLNSMDTGCNTTSIKLDNCDYWYTVILPEEVHSDMVSRNTGVEENIEITKKVLKEQKE